jgi:uncharacterized protein (DUF302 family)
MSKALLGFIFGIFVIVIYLMSSAGSLMFNEIESPFGVEETAARIQANVQSLSSKGWKLSGLRNPSRAVATDGGNVLPVLIVEACSTAYSGPMLKDGATQVLSVLMPCSISVYKKDNGKVYVGMMNAGLMGKLFGSKVASVMAEVASDQKIFITFDPSKPAPPLIKIKPGGGGAGGKDEGGC